jgi:hypothetical protein
MLLQGVREVAALANPANPEAVSQRAFDRARATSADHADLPAARQIARELKLKWPEVLTVAHAPENRQANMLANKANHEHAPHGWVTDARIRYALRLVAGRLGVNALSRAAYSEERDVLLNEDARDWLHGGRLRLPDATAMVLARGGWRALLRIAGLKEYSPPTRTIPQVIVSRVEVMDRFYDRYREQPSFYALVEFARGNKIPMTQEGGRKYSEAIAEWRQRRRDRGESEPRVVEYKGRVKRPDFSANVGAAKPGEHLYRGKWDDEDLCVAWVAYYLGLHKGKSTTSRTYDEWASHNLGAPKRYKFQRHGGWSVVRRKAEEQLHAQGPPTGPPTPGPKIRLS